MRVHNQRLLDIQAGLRQQPRVSIRELADRYAVSTMTIRRDLEILEARGVLARTFGGAMAVVQDTVSGHPVIAPAPTRQAIGRRAAALVERGHTILVDAGTTTLEVVRHLPRDHDVTLVTNSLPAIAEVQGSGMRVLALGGYVSSDDVRLYGPMTESCLAQLHADLLFVGCVGASTREGFFMSDLYLTSNVQAMIRAAGRVVVVAESTKFHHRALSAFARPIDVHVLVTDTGLSDDDRIAIEAQGVEVLMVEAATQSE